MQTFFITESTISCPNVAKTDEPTLFKTSFTTNILEKSTDFAWKWWSYYLYVLSLFLPLLEKLMQSMRRRFTTCNTIVQLLVGIDNIKFISAVKKLIACLQFLQLRFLTSVLSCLTIPDCWLRKLSEISSIECRNEKIVSSAGWPYHQSISRKVSVWVKINIKL